jgi:archaemetzincin
MKYLFWILIPILFSCKRIYRLTDGRTTIIGIQPFRDIDKEFLDSIKSALAYTYSFKIITLPTINLPSNSFVNVKSPRYRAEKLIYYLWKNKPDSIDYIIGITNKDISTTKRDQLGRVKKPELKYKDWGVMGLGYCPGKSCIVSTFRLKSQTQRIFIERLQKVVVHELGHNLWLPHCPSKGCVMSDANETIRTVDREKLMLCRNCRKKVRG